MFYTKQPDSYSKSMLGTGTFIQFPKNIFCSITATFKYCKIHFFARFLVLGSFKIQQPQEFKIKNCEITYKSENWEIKCLCVCPTPEPNFSIFHGVFMETFAVTVDSFFYSVSRSSINNMTCLPTEKLSE